MRINAAMLLGLSLIGLTRPAAAQFGETIEVRLHNLDVVVETRSGELVTGLKQEDFVVKQDGVLQAVTHFRINAEPSEFVNVPLPNPAEPRRRETRRLVFFLDETPLHEKARTALLEQCTALVQAMAPNDEVMIVTPAAIKHVPLFFTTDKNRALHMIEKLTLQMMRIRDAEALGRDMAGVPIMEDFISEELPDGFLRRGDCSQSLEQCAKNRIAVLQSVVDSLAAVPGRKVLLMMSRRFTSAPGWKLTQQDQQMVENPVMMLEYPAVLTHGKNLKPLVEDVARAASASNVTIYAIEPYEPGDVALGGMSAENKGLSPTLERGEPGVLDAMLTVARLTGGRAFGGTREFDDLFRQVARDQAYYYSIAFPDRGERNVSHGVEVTIRNRPNLVVRTRGHVSAASHETELSRKAVGALLTAKPANALGIAVDLDDFVSVGRVIEIPVTIRIPFNKLTMIEDGDGFRGAVHLYVAIVEGDKLEFGKAHQKKVQEVVLSRSQWEGSRNGYFNYQNTVRVKPGRYRLSIGVTDAASGEAGFQTFDVVAQPGS
jgi:VWFA-related protein